MAAFNVQVKQQIPQIDPKSFQAFKEGVESVFRQWTALELAIANQWGGVNSIQKAEILLQKTLSLFCGKERIYKDDVEIMLEEYMELELQTICEDNSPQELSLLLVDMWRQCEGGDFTLVTNALAREYCRHEVKALEKSIEMTEDDELDENEIKMETVMEIEDEIDTAEIAASIPRVDAEGFEIVGKKSRRKPR